MLKANGKLLLSGEYLVLNGAKALAFPICFGQNTDIEFISEPKLIFKSNENNQEWFTTTFTLPNLDIFNTTSNLIAIELKNILLSAQSLNKDFLSTQSGFSININANYPLKFGFGSSSTLISLIARWANVNEYTLFKMVSNGSGYDIACATQNTPIFYQLIDETPVITKAEIGNGIKRHCIFAYLGNKQNSKEEVERYMKYEIPSKKIIDRISKLSKEICEASNAIKLIESIIEHEEILSSVINKPILNDHDRFHNFNGPIKSLGAWGGDFAMFVAAEPLYIIRNDIKKLGIKTMFSYDELKIKA